MSRPRLLLVLAALIALAGVAAILIWQVAGQQGSPRQLVDERAGHLRGVRFGDSAARVRTRLGEPTDDGEGFFPEDTDFTGPPAIPVPASDRGSRMPPATLHYDDAAYLVSRTAGVFAMAALGRGAETRSGVGVGDRLERVRERYADVDCGEAVAGESLFGGESPKYPWCRTRVGTTRIFFGEDPIESITLTRPP